MRPIAFYITGHGFGHASRDLEIINALRAREPHRPVTVCTQVPQWLINYAVTQPVERREIECDTGVHQIDSLHVDEAGTLRRAAEFYEDLDRRVAVEVDFLRESDACLVLGDIPPLAFVAAARAGLDSIAIGNFTWDWIYEDYPDERGYPELLPRIRQAYACASLALRLPMHGGFGGLERVTRDIPFVARRSLQAPAEIRRALGLPTGVLFLLSFGGYGLRAVDPTALERLTNYTTVITDDASGRDLWQRHLPNIIRISGAQLREAGCRYQDLIRAVDVVVTKPGYGIVSECIANETAILYTSRGHFREYDVIVAAMQKYTRCEFIDNDSLLSGRWQPEVERLLAAPAPRERPPIDGAEVAAGIILDAIPSRR